MIRTAILIVMVACVAVSGQTQTKTTITQDGKFQVEETLIYDKKLGGKMLGQKISPDRLTLALVVEKRGWQAVWTEKYGRSDYYNGVMGLFFSPDSKRFAYVATDKHDKTEVVVDGQLVGKYGSVVNNQVLFTDNNESYAFIMSEKKHSREIVVINGVKQPKYTKLMSLNPEDPIQLLAVDGGRVVYFARQDNDHFAVIDGQRGPSFEATGFGPTFSDDFAHIAYGGMRDSLMYIVVDSVLHGPYPEVSHVHFPPGSSEPAYIVHWPDSSRIFLNHKLQPTKYKWVRAPIYTDSGTVRAFWASDGKKAYVVNGADEDISGVQEYYNLTTPWESNHGGHLIHKIIFDEKETRKSLVIDGKLMSAMVCPGTANAWFSEDGSHYTLCCFEEKPMKTTVWIDDQFGPYEGMWIDPVTFSHEGSRWATRVISKEGVYLLVDGVRIDIDAAPSQVHFSPDGKHLAYTLSQSKKSKEHLVIDETEFDTYTAIGGNDMEFSPDGTLTLFPREKEAKLYRVKVSPAQ